MEVVPVEADEIADLLALDVDHPQDEPAGNLQRRAVARGDLRRPGPRGPAPVLDREASRSLWNLRTPAPSAPPGVRGSVPQPAHDMMAAENRFNPGEEALDEAARGQGGDGDRLRRRARLRAGDRPTAGGGGSGSPPHGRRAGRYPGREREAGHGLARARGGRRRGPRSRPPGGDRPRRCARRLARSSARSIWPTRRSAGSTSSSTTRPPRRAPTASRWSSSPEDAWHVILKPTSPAPTSAARPSLRSMVARGTRGRIINMSSNCGKVGYRATGRLLRLEVRRDRVHAGARPGARASPDHRERDLPRLGRHRPARLPRPARRRQLRPGAPRERHHRSGGPDPARARRDRRRRGGARRRSSARMPPATSPDRRSTWPGAPSCTDAGAPRCQ